MIKQLDGPTCRLMREKVQAALDTVGPTLNLTLRIGSISYSATGETASFKVSAGVIGADGQGASKEGDDFKKYAGIYGLKPEQLGQKFTVAGNEYEVVGLKTRAQKLPLIAKRADGRRFKFSVKVIGGDA